MRRLALLLLSAIALHAEEARPWTLAGIAPFNAELIAADGLRATLLVPGRGKTVIPFAQMSPADAAYVHEWRARNPEAPLVDPERLAAWPGWAAAESLEVRMTSEDAAASRWHYESAHFSVDSDLKLPVSVVGDFTAVFEATRAALIALPLGLHLGDETQKYRVLMLSSALDYGHAGGHGGSGGTYNAHSGKMLLLLPNLGIRPGTNGLTLDYQRNLFILKHEVTHQILGAWQEALPIWLSEGFCECIAAVPYTRGRYAFQGLDAAMHDYVLKWRTTGNPRELQLIPPARLMAFDAKQWNDEVAARSAYALYNSAALLTYYFLHADGRGDGANLAAFFDDLRRGVSASDAEAKRLLRDRTQEVLAAEVQAYSRKLGLMLKIDPPPAMPVGR